ncbi:glycosyltransferase family 4 protein [Nostoc sp. UHCC 0702]|nr:glycosyltransferase family 4 protein [Nostoc sp. UHCC 0702]
MKLKKMYINQNNPRTLVFSLLPLKKTGGGESYTFNCANSISTSGIDCDLVAPVEGNFIRIKDNSRFESLFEIKRFIGRQSSFSNFHEKYRDILSNIPNYKYIWIHQYLASSLVFDLLVLTHNKQIILFTNHGFEENYHDFWIRYIKLPNHFFLEVSQYSARRTKKYTSNVSYVYGGAWKSKLAKLSTTSLEKKKQFVCVGRLLPHKGFEVAIDALSKDDTLVIIGPDSEDDSYKKFLQMKAKGKNVHFTGEILLTDKDKIISESVALIANSSSVTYHQRTFEQSELLGLVVIESILNNTLPITSSQPALKEIMTVLKLNELVYTERDFKSLKSKMLFIHSLPDAKYQLLLDKAKEIIMEQFLWDNYWLSVKDIINHKNTLHEAEAYEKK